MAIDIQEEYGYGHDNTYTDDEDGGNKRKYVRRGEVAGCEFHVMCTTILFSYLVLLRSGPFYTQLLRQFGSFWSPSHYSLPVTMRPKDKAEREAVMAEELVEGRSRRRGRRAGMDRRKVLLGVAIA